MEPQNIQTPNKQPAQPAQDNSAPEPPIPNPFSPAAQKKPGGNIKTIAIIAGVLAVLFLITTIYFAARSSTSQQALNTQYQNGYKQGLATQKTQDDKDYAAQQNSDFKVYKASDEYGNFELSLPKSWSTLITPGGNTGTFKAIAAPNYVDTTNSIEPFKLDLTKDNYDDKKKNLDSQVKGSKGAMQSSEITVSGIKGMKYTGPTDKKTKLIPEVVIVPVREKTFVFSTDDSATYGAIFNTTLQNVKLNP